MSLPLRCLTIPAVKKHSATIIFIHGLGDTGYGWEPVTELIRQDPALNHVKWVLPHSAVNLFIPLTRFSSPILPVTANLGVEMPSWFNVFSFGLSAPEDEAGMKESTRLLEKVVADEVNSGTPSERILLGGFSQGGAMALLVGLTSQHKFAAVSILSSWLPLRKNFKSMVGPHATSMPIFWGYGSDDGLIRGDLTKESLQILESTLEIPRAKELGAPGLTVERYEGMGHETNFDELDDLKRFIIKCIPDDA